MTPRPTLAFGLCALGLAAACQRAGTRDNGAQPAATAGQGSTDQAAGGGQSGDANTEAAGHGSSGAAQGGQRGATANAGGGAGGGAGQAGASAVADAGSAGPSDGDGEPIKGSSMQVLAHVMPWFETPESSGSWGVHWTMATQDPNVTDAEGKHQIASKYYPLIGPYASGDPDVIEYQLLLMKYSGIDGVLIDWPGTIDLYDYAANRANAEAMIARTAAIGLSFAVVYEDQNVNIALGAGAIDDTLAAGSADLQYAQNQYFARPNYVQFSDAPLLLVFGPQTFQDEASWGNLFASLTEAPALFTLWHESNEAGAHATGEFAWPVEQGLTALQQFYAGDVAGSKIGAAFPGFDSFYAQGGWAGPTWVITRDDGATWQAALDQAIASGVDYLQLCTWNDYGEGTQLEPTRELQFTPLVQLQQKLGVRFGESELHLVYSLYQQRKQYAGDAAKQSQLDHAFTALTQLHVSEAAALLQ